jgi:GntR family transcriptional repressor for pyruvate dehydrogenase complex
MSPVSSLPLRPVKTVRAFENVCDQIRQQIAAGILMPGDKLPPERELAQEFNVGRPAMREALRTLEITGVIALQKGATGGAFICRQDHPARVAQLLTEVLGAGFQQLEDAREAYASVFGVLAALSAERADGAQIKALKAASNAADTAVGPQARNDATAHVVALIADCARNPALKLLFDSLSVVVWPVADLPAEDRVVEMSRARLKLLDAICAHDAIAAGAAAHAFADAYLPLSTTDRLRPAL